MSTTGGRHRTDRRNPLKQEVDSRLLCDPGDLTERGGKDNPCHNQTSVARSRNKKALIQGFFDGRYWARTSDPQLVERGLGTLRAPSQSAWLSQNQALRDRGSTAKYLSILPGWREFGHKDRPCAQTRRRLNTPMSKNPATRHVRGIRCVLGPRATEWAM